MLSLASTQAIASCGAWQLFGGEGTQSFHETLVLVQI
jgi:hypothetical protein